MFHKEISYQIERERKRNVKKCHVTVRHHTLIIRYDDVCVDHAN